MCWLVQLQGDRYLDRYWGLSVGVCSGKVTIITSVMWPLTYQESFSEYTSVTIYPLSLSRKHFCIVNLLIDFEPNFFQNTIRSCFLEKFPRPFYHNLNRSFNQILESLLIILSLFSAAFCFHSGSTFFESAEATSMKYVHKCILLVHQ